MKYKGRHSIGRTIRQPPTCQTLTDPSRYFNKPRHMLPTLSPNGSTSLISRCGRKSHQYRRLLFNLILSLTQQPPAKFKSPNIQAWFEALAQAAPELASIFYESSSSLKVIYLGEISPGAAGAADSAVSNPRA